MMNRILVSSLVFLSAFIAAGTAQAPIPSRPPGFVYGSGSCAAPVVLETWVDLICPDSKAAWLTYQKVADHYGPQTLRLSALLYPLPYHRAAMMAAQGSFIAEMLEPNKTYDWFDRVFAKQAELYNANIFKEPDSYIVNMLSDWAGEVGYSKTQFKEHLVSSDPTQALARVQFKYGSTRGVYGTPLTYINGAMVASDSRWTLEDWTKVIDPIIEEYLYYTRLN